MAGVNDQAHMTLDDYPGAFSRIDASKYIFPEIRYFHGNDRVASVQLVIQGCYGSPDQADEAERQKAFVPCALSAGLFRENPAEPFYCRLLTVTKLVKESEKAATLIKAGKNLGRVNSTSIFHQALVDAYSKYKDLISTKRVSPDSPHLSDIKNNSISELIQKAAERVKPMLACSEEPSEWFAAHPQSIVQPKFNGTRMMVTRRNADRRMVAYSRDLKDLPPNNCWNDILRLSADYPDIIFDGECYEHGKTLQEISGSVRNTGKTTPRTAHNIKFMIFDVFDPDRPKQPYAERYLHYMKIRDDFAGRGIRFEFIDFVVGVPYKSWAEVEHRFEVATTIEGYEGLMLKDLAAIYEPSYNNKHSSAICKYKREYDAEFMCIGWEVGEGKAAGKVTTWRMQVVEASRTGVLAIDAGLARANGATFKTNIQANDETREAWYKLFMEDPGAFDRDFRGRMATVKFFEVSKDGIPTQPFWTSFRDYEGGEPAGERVAAIDI